MAIFIRSLKISKLRGFCSSPISSSGIYGKKLESGVVGKKWAIIALCIMQVFGMSSRNPREGHGEITLWEDSWGRIKRTEDYG